MSSSEGVHKVQSLRNSNSKSFPYMNQNGLFDVIVLQHNQVGRSLNQREKIGIQKQKKIQLNSVYIHPAPIYIPLELVSRCNSPLKVDFRSENWENVHGGTVELQLDNHNVQSDEIVRSPPGSVVSGSNLHDDLSDEGDTPRNGDFNEMFNLVNIIDNVTLKPNERKRVVLMYRSVSSEDPFMLAPNVNHTESSKPTLANVPNTSYLEVSTSLLFTASVLHESTQRDWGVGNVAVAPDLESRGHGNSRKGNPREVETITIPLQVRACKSNLECDVSQIVFDNCVPGGLYVKEFTIWNRSEVPLVFVLHKPPAPNEDLFTVQDYENARDLKQNTPITVPGYSHIRVSVTYRPLVVGETTSTLVVENLHNSNNKVKVKVHAVVTEHLHRNGLLVRELNRSVLRSGDVLSYGKCYVGMFASRVLRIKNLTDLALDVHLSSNCKGEVTFGLLAEDVPEGRGKPGERLALDRKGTDGLQTMGEEADDEDADEEEDDVDDDDDGTNEDGNSDSENDNAANSNDENDQGELPQDPSKGRDGVGSEGRIGGMSLLRSASSDQAAEAADDGAFGGAHERSASPILSEGVHVERSSSRNGRSTSSRNRQAGAGSAASNPSRRSKMKDKGSSTNRLSQQIQMLPLEPGMEQKVVVWYCPVKYSELGQVDDDDDDVDNAFAMRTVQDTLLTKRDFYIALRCRDSRSRFGGADDDEAGEGEPTEKLATKATHGRQDRKSKQPTSAKQKDKRREDLVDRYSRTIQVEAKACCSKITVTPSELNFGDCNIGERKRAMVSVFNHSDLKTRIQVLVQSKVVSVGRSVVEVGPRETQEVEVLFLPRKINPNYSRAVHFKNLNNEQDTTVVNVRASNMDPHHVIYHSLFYKLNTRVRRRLEEVKERSTVELASETQGINTASDNDMAQEIQFGEVTARSPTLECFELTNITSKPLRLQLSTSRRRELAIFFDPTLSPPDSFRVLQPRHDSAKSLRPGEESRELPPPPESRFAGDVTDGTSTDPKQDPDLEVPLEMLQVESSVHSRPWDSPGSGLYFRSLEDAPRDGSATAKFSQSEGGADLQQLQLPPAVRAGDVVENLEALGSAPPLAPLDLTRSRAESDSPKVATTPTVPLAPIQAPRHQSFDGCAELPNFGSKQGAFTVNRRPRSYTEDVVSSPRRPDDARASKGLDVPLESENQDVVATRTSKTDLEERGLVSHDSWRESIRSRTGIQPAGLSVESDQLDLLAPFQLPNILSPSPLHVRPAAGDETSNPSRKERPPSSKRANLDHLADLFRPAERFFYVGLSPDQEAEHVQRTALRMQLLRDSVASGTIVHIKQDQVLELAVGATVTLGLLMTASVGGGGDSGGMDAHFAWEQGKLRSTSGKILISIQDLDDADLERLWKVHRWATYRPDKGGAPPAEPGRDAEDATGRMTPAFDTASENDDVATRSDVGDKDSRLARKGGLALASAGNDLSLALRQGIVPVREVPVVANVAQSIMVFAQKHINFGTVTIGSATRTGVLMINNKAAVPLLYHISKSGSIASSFFKITHGKCGVVRPYGNRSVRFLFRPTLAGVIEENLTVTNVADPTASQTTVVKANVIRQQNLALAINPDFAHDSHSSASHVDFGQVNPGSIASVEHVIAVQSLSKRTRKVVVRSGGFATCDAQGSSTAHLSKVPGIEFAFELDEGIKEISPEDEEKLEHLEHKLRIATRKNQTSKAESCSKKLAALRAKCGLAKDGSRIPTNLPPREPDSKPYRPDEELLTTFTKRFTFELQPSTTLRLRVKAFLSSGALSEQSAYNSLKRIAFEGRLKGTLEFIEGKNEDTVKSVEFSVNLQEPAKQGIREKVKQQVDPQPATSERNGEEVTPVPEPGAPAKHETRGESPKKEKNPTGSRPNEKISESAVATADVASLPITTRISSDKLAKKSEKPVADVTVDSPVIDFGSVTTGTWHERAITLSNNSLPSANAKPLVFRVESGEPTSDATECAFETSGGHARARFKVQPWTGALRAGERVSLQLRTQFIAGGLHRHMFRIRVMQPEDVVPGPAGPEALVREKELAPVDVAVKARLLYLHFVDLDPPLVGTPSVLDLGMCYANAPPRQLAGDWKAWAARPSVGRTSLVVKNVYCEDLTLHTTSSLNRQVFVYSDPGLRTTAQRMVVPRGESRALYVTVKPRLLEDSWEGNAKTLRGAITLAGRPVGHQTSGAPFHFECNVRFTATMGISLMRVQPSVVNLARALREEELGGRQGEDSCARGSFYVTNVNKRMPLRYHVQVKNDESNGYGEGCWVEIENPEGQLPGGGRKLVHFRLHADRFGVMEKRLVVVNDTESGRSQQHPLEREVSVRAILHNASLGVKFSNLSLGPDPWDAMVPAASTKWGTLEPVKLPPVPVVPLNREVYYAMAAHNLVPPRSGKQQSSSKRLGDSHGADPASRPLQRPSGHVPDPDEMDARQGGHGESGGNTLISSQKDNMALLKSVHKFHFADHRTYWRNLLTIVNKSDRAILVHPECRKGMRIQLRWADASDQPPAHSVSLNQPIKMVEVPQKHHAPPPLEFVECGEPLMLEPGASAVAHLNIMLDSLVRATPFGLLANAQLVPGNVVGRYFRGMMLLKTSAVASPPATDTREVSAMLWLESPLCMSRFRINKRVVSAGKLGVVNGWQSREFRVQVQNLVPGLPLHLRVVCPGQDGLTPLGRLEVLGTTDPEDKVEATRDSQQSSVVVSQSQSQGTATLRMRLSFDERAKRQLKRGNRSFKLRVINLANPFNSEEVTVDGHMVVGLIELKFQDSFGSIGTDSQSVKKDASEAVEAPHQLRNGVVLPPLTIPTPQATHPLKCNTWFLVTNVYDDAMLEVRFEIIPNPKLDGIVEFSVLSRMSNAPPPNRTIELGRRASFAVRVVMHAADHVNLWREDQEYLVAKTIRVATLQIHTSVKSSKHSESEVRVSNTCAASVEDLDIMGFLVPGQQMALSSNKVMFYTTQYRAHMLDEGIRSSLDIQHMHAEEPHNLDKRLRVVQKLSDADRSGANRQTTSEHSNDQDEDDIDEDDARASKGLSEDDADDEGGEEEEDNTDGEEGSVSEVGKSLGSESYLSPDESKVVANRAKFARQKSIASTPGKRNRKRSNNPPRSIAKPSAKISPAVCLSARSIYESFWITNKSDTMYLRFSIKSTYRHQKGLRLLLPQSQAVRELVRREVFTDRPEGSDFPSSSRTREAARSCVVTDNVTASVYPESGSLGPNQSARVVVWLSQAYHAPGVQDESSEQDRTSPTISLLVSNDDAPAAPPSQVTLVIEKDASVALREESSRRGVNRGTDTDSQIVDFTFISKMLDDNAAYASTKSASQRQRVASIAPSLPVETEASTELQAPTALGAQKPSPDAVPGVPDSQTLGDIANLSTSALASENTTPEASPKSCQESTTGTELEVATKALSVGTVPGAEPSQDVPPPASSIVSSQPGSVHENQSRLSTTRSEDRQRAKEFLMIKLRGCTPVKKSTIRYEVNVGQRLYSSGTVVWELTLESILGASGGATRDRQRTAIVDAESGREHSGTGEQTMLGQKPNWPNQIEYKLYTVDEGDGKWVELSRNSGVLRGAHDYANFTLHFSTEVFGNFTTYLIVENTTHSWDIKLIRLSMEVVSNSSQFSLLRHALLQQAHTPRVEDSVTSLFSVMVNGKMSDDGSVKGKNRSNAAQESKKEALEIEIGNICATWLCSEVSFVLKNKWDIPLDFLLSHNAPSSELRFSTDCEFLCEAQSVTVAAHSELRVYVFWVPGTESDLIRAQENEPSSSTKNSNEDSSRGGTEDNKTSNRGKNTSTTRRVRSSASLVSMKSEAGVQLGVELYVTCRLLNDFRKTILLKARVHMPQISLRLNDVQVPAHQVTGGGKTHIPEKITDGHFRQQFEFQNADLLFTSRTLVEAVRGGSQSGRAGRLGDGRSDALTKLSTATSSTGPESSNVQKEDGLGWCSWLLDPGCAARLVSVVNKADKPCYFCVVNNTRYFNIRLCAGAAPTTSTGSEIGSSHDVAGLPASQGREPSARFLYAYVAGRSCCTLEVSLNESEMIRDQEMLSRILHVEEHITINNFLWDKFHEFKRLKVRFSCGPYRRFSVLPTDKLSSFRLAAMEEQVGHFISEMNTMWEKVRRFPIFARHDGSLSVNDWLRGGRVVPSTSGAEAGAMDGASLEGAAAGVGLSASSVADSLMSESASIKNNRGYVEPKILVEMLRHLESYLLDNPRAIGEEQLRPASRGGKDDERASVPYSAEETRKRMLARAYAQAFFEFQSTTDELVHYVCKPFVGRLVFSVANLLYGVALRHEVFTMFLHKKAPPMPSLLVQWWKELQRFLNSVPHDQPMIAQLRKMLAKFKKRRKMQGKWKGPS